MRRTIVAAGVAAAVIGVGGATLAGGFQYRTTATGAEEVPVRSTSAEAKINLKVEGDSVTYNLRITEPIDNLTMAHLHAAPAGQNGPIAVWLYPDAPPAQLIPGTTEGRLVKGVIEPSDLCAGASVFCGGGQPDWDAFLAALDGGGLYLNVHTSQFPGGEVRGQVHPNGHG
jgi:hypothetical protein